MTPDQLEHLRTAAVPLGSFYAALAAANAVAAGRAWRRGNAGRPGRPLRKTFAWLGVAACWTILAAMAFAGHPLEVPAAMKQAIDAATTPATLFTISLAGLAIVFFGRRWFAIPTVGWTILNLSLLPLGASLADQRFARTVLQPDCVPIVAMVYLLGFFLWLAVAQAVENDRRRRDCQLPLEHDFRGKTLVWPDLVYIELIATLLVSAGLIVWSLVVRAPLEQPANAALTPNPAKAPWFFLGLQELLVYFDPTMAGVVIPGLAVLGLMAIPYLDRSPKESGYYTIDQRPVAAGVYLFGFVQLWIVLVLAATFFRGPNWEFFGPFEPRQVHQATIQTSMKLSDVFWGATTRPASVLARESPGLVVLGVYFAVVPLVLGRTLLRTLRRQMGRGRYWLMAILMLMMLGLPLKMVLRWTCNLSYVVSMPEWYFNF
jgi:hypothetical protein